MWFMYTVEYYPHIKKNEVLLSAAEWMELEVIMLNEVNWTWQVSIAHLSSYVAAK